MSFGATIPPFDDVKIVLGWVANRSEFSHQQVAPKRCFQILIPDTVNVTLLVTLELE